MTTATVVGGGPNGLAAAVALTKAGVQVTVLEAAGEIGGGTRTSEALLPGLLHDQCSATHPMAVGSAFLNGLNLERYGLSWRTPEIDCVHPLDQGRGAALHRSIERTADGLGRDGERWRLLFGAPSARFDALSEDIMRPLLRFPHHPLTLARFGLPTVLPGSTLARLFRTDEARALFGGVAAHAFRPLHYPLTSAIGLGILTAGHRHGWPVAAGGSQSITNALAALLTDLGGKIETDTRIEAAERLPTSDVTMFDLAPDAVAGILGDRLPSRIARAYQLFGRDPARSRWTSRSRAGCRGPTPMRAGPARYISRAATANSPPPSGRSTPDGCRSGRSCWSVSSIWPIRSARSGMCTGPRSRGNGVGQA
jgi:phytoene dehydrogenase-like protein